MKIKVPLLIAFFVILLSASVVSFEDDNIVFGRQDLTLALKTSGSIQLDILEDDYQISSVKANVSFRPLDSWRQKVLNIETEPYSKVDDDHVLFSWSNPRDKKLYYEISSRVKTVNDYKGIDSKISFPIEESEIPENIRGYLDASEIIDSGNTKIIDRANLLAEGEDDLFLLSHKIGKWVKKNVRYELTTANVKASQKASWVLNNKQGVCDEISVLFIALNRALGIPARFVSGIAYTNSELFSERWGSHGWAEVYFPGKGWIPFDITYDQMGFIDAGHITSKISSDPAEPSTNFFWRSYGVDISPSSLKNTVEILSYGEEVEDLITLSAEPESEEVGLGSFNLIKVDVTNKNNHYLPVTLQISKIDEIENVDSSKKELMLKPKETKTTYFKVKIDNDLDEGYVYTFPFTIYSLRNESVDVQFKAKKDTSKLSEPQIDAIASNLEQSEKKEYSKDFQMSCSPSKESFRAGDTVTISCNTQNLGNTALDDVSICLEDECVEHDYKIAEKKKINFTKKFGSEGLKEVLIFADNEFISKKSSAQVRVMGVPVLSIEEVKLPETVEYEDSFPLRFLIKKESFSDALETNVVVENGKLREEWGVGNLSEDRQMVINMKGSELFEGRNDIRIKVEYEDETGEVYEVQKTASITLNKLSLSQKISIKISYLFKLIEQKLGFL